MNSDPPKAPLGIFPSSWSEQRTGRIPGHIPIWVGILSELTEFGIFFVAYFIAKYNYPEAFSQGPLKCQYPRRGKKYIDLTFKQLLYRQSHGLYSARQSNQV
jgi:heme/copper-type cytochrome/quinol oxidase subunit 3